MEIVAYKPQYAKAFLDLNIEWLETYFYVEPYDREVLSNPEKYIIKPGGFVFFVVEDTQVVGTVALLKRDDKRFELTKMAVLPKKRGKNIGHLLLQYCLDFAEKNEMDLFLYSNTMLENAIHLYRKFGFVEVPLPVDNPYKRSNIKMEHQKSLL